MALAQAADALSARILAFYLPDDWSEGTPRGVTLLAFDGEPHYAVAIFHGDDLRCVRRFEHQVEALSAFARSADDAFLTSITF
jgi:hypothetical protein